MKKTLVLAGGGHAHLSVLRALADQRSAARDVLLITPERHQNYSGMLPGWMAGHYAVSDCRIDLAPLVQAAGAQLLLDAVVGLDAARHCVVLNSGRQVHYDLLSLDVGSETNTSWLQVLGAKLLPIKPLDAFFTQWPRVVSAAKAKPGYRLVVVGGGAAGVEMVLAAQHAFANAGLVVQIDLVASEHGLLPGHASAVQARVLRLVQQAGVSLHRQRAVGTPDGVLLSDGRLLAADLVLAATGARAAVWLGLSKLRLSQDGYLLVDQQHRSVSHPNVFAAGDVCARADATLQRSGVHAVHAGPVLAHNLLATLKGGTLHSYAPKRRSLYLLACGPRYAVASWGRWSAEGQWVWRWKDWIDRRFISRFSARPESDAASLLERTP